MIENQHNQTPRCCIDTKSQSLKSSIGKTVSVVGGWTIALTSSVKRSNFQGAIYNNWHRKQLEVRLFIAASWQHFVRDGSLVPEYLKAVFQTPGASLTCKYKIEVSAFLAQLYHLQSNWPLSQYTTQLDKSTDKRISLWALSEPLTVATHPS